MPVLAEDILPRFLCEEQNCTPTSRSIYVSCEATGGDTESHPLAIRLATVYERAGTIEDEVEYVGEMEQSQQTEKRAAVVVGQVASALSLLHANGFAHGDVKPGNIFVERAKGRPVVLGDLGSVVEEGREVSRRFRVCSYSPGYVSPEILAQRGGQKSKASDIWALGIIGLELLSGIPVIDQDNWEEETRNFCLPGELQVALLDVSNESFKQLLLQMISLNPAERPAVCTRGGLRLAGVWVSGQCATAISSALHLCVDQTQADSGKGIRSGLPQSESITQSREDLDSLLPMSGGCPFTCLCEESSLAALVEENQKVTEKSRRQCPSSPSLSPFGSTQCLSFRGSSTSSLPFSLQEGGKGGSHSRQPETPLPVADQEVDCDSNAVFDFWGTLEEEGDMQEGLVLPGCLQSSSKLQLSRLAKESNTQQLTHGSVTRPEDKASVPPTISLTVGAESSPRPDTSSDSSGQANGCWSAFRNFISSTLIPEVQDLCANVSDVVVEHGKLLAVCWTGSG
uniref:Protein kinase domain-containing protein n=1 Tax=Chromera velia CCMP2878 TaxID=1169474 RepID=A0A0G4FTA1_9ALVE|eukprot:Cvel_18650.t1-p1 / transcript=Cvel_18650.t1 / gene=Cvel_18650 / organism=Chromera_velia_CCMP2878 / gene_product=Calcium/calmodulin-dependent protein kinase type 1B, putative / transcript_product=Calcium/calmodulin-dependent protein kinase type 1B, putative / location=Cvel_scaffold1558:22737-27357(-) / protein_length=511 / sequence_SO=supercontig / SO=protein_coding / is_pseudo=false